MMTTYILQSSGESLRMIDVDFSAFPDGDTHCLIPDIEQLSKAPVLIVHFLYPDQNEQFIRLLLLMDLLHEYGVSEVSVFCPYLPYSRQDKQHVHGEALGAHTICRTLARAGCLRLYVIDAHFMRGTEQAVYERLDIYNISATEMLMERCSAEFLSTPEYEIIGPDKGAALLSTGEPSQHMHKQRGEYATAADKSLSREITKHSAEHIIVTQPTIVIVDDMVSTGSTMLRAICNLRAKGSKRIYCVITHGLFIGDSYTELKKLSNGIIVGDSVPCPDGQPITQELLQTKVIPRWLTHSRTLGQLP